MIMNNLKDTESNCLFCKIVSGKVASATVVEEEKILSFMDIQQSQPGHVLIIPRKHYNNFSEIPLETGSSMMILCHKMAKAIYNSFNPQGITIYLSDGEAAGQVIPHVHLHLQPRAKGDDLLNIKETKTSETKELLILAEQLKAEVH